MMRVPMLMVVAHDQTVLTRSIGTIDLQDSRIGYEGISVRSVYWDGERIACGTEDGEIIEVDYHRKTPEIVMQGHAEGELWGLATHPKQPVFVTASDDKSVRCVRNTTYSYFECARVGRNQYPLERCATR